MNPFARHRLDPPAGRHSARHAAAGRRALALAAGVALATGGAALLSGAGVIGAQHAGASGATLRPGLGYHVAGGGLVGFYLSNGTKVYCLDPGKASPARVTLHRTARYPGAGAAVTTELSYALTRWGDASTVAGAAIESQVLNTLVGNLSAVQTRAQQIPARLRRAVRARVRAAQAFHGPYTVDVRTPVGLLPGQHATGTVTVVSGAGVRVPHVGLVLRHSRNSSTPDWTRTNSRGVASFDYGATDVGAIRVRADAVALPAPIVLAGHPSRGYQHMVTWARRRPVRGRAVSVAHPGGMTASYSCTSTCDGQPVVTLRACAPRHTAPARLRYLVGSRAVVIGYPVGTAGRCRSTSVRARDGDRISATWQFRTPSGWSRHLHAAGSIVVDCPAVPAVAALLRYDCSRAGVLISLSEPGLRGGWQPLVNRGRRRLVLVIGGARSARIYADPGQRAEFRASAACSSPVTYTMQAGIRRANGAYNYGPQASVTTPSIR